MHRGDKDKALFENDGRPMSWSIASQMASALDPRSAPLIWADVYERNIGVPIGIWANGVFETQHVGSVGRD
jgi:hypothetical protein